MANLPSEAFGLLQPQGARKRFPCLFGLISHLQEHLFDVDNSQRLGSPAEIFVQYDELPDRDLVGFDTRAADSKERVHVANEARATAGGSSIDLLRMCGT
jgi:hypothetical protein